MIAAAVTASAAPVTLENEFWKITLEPEYGARASAMTIKENGEELVKNWKKPARKIGKRPPTKQQYQGGALGGHMCGSYLDEQLDAEYQVEKSSSTHIIMRWRNSHSVFAGLEETREITLDDNNIRVAIQVENLADEKRVIYYRLQDFIGTGKNLGMEAVYLYTDRNGLKGKALAPSNLSNSTLPLLHSPANWFAMADMLRDYGVKVQTINAPVSALMFWIAAGDQRTTEIFWTPTHLEPGQKWQTEIIYSIFKPSKESNELSEKNINRLLNLQPGQTSYATGMQFSPAMGKAVITPLHGTEQIPERITERFKSLSETELFGTQGETILGAFSITALEPLPQGTIQFTEFTDATGKKLELQVDPRYISRDACNLMVHDWQLAVNMPEEASTTRSTVKDTPALTPFKLDTGESAHIRTYFRIQENASPGDYRSICTVDAGSAGKYQFTVKLKVYPYKLEMPPNKGYGAFCTFSLAGDPNQHARTHGMTRENFRKAMEALTARHWRNMVIYVEDRDNVFWVLDLLAELGWRDASFVLLRPRMTHQELMERYKKYNFYFMPWTVDEPVDFHSLQTGVRRYESYQKRSDFPTANFSANTPLSLALIDLLPQTEPTIAVTGNIMYFVEKTRELRQSGRRVFWYAGTPERGVRGRLLRGVYVWKEPVCGMMDWGEVGGSSGFRNSNHGFLGNGELIPAQRAELLTQATYDLMYLHTMEQALKNNPSSPAAAETQAMINWLKSRFDIDYTGEALEIDHYFLDMIRRQAAEFTVLLKTP